MSVHRLPDRDVPPMPPWTTLAALEAEHKRLKALAAQGTPEAQRTPTKWDAHIARALRPWALLRGTVPPRASTEAEATTPAKQSVETRYGPIPPITEKEKP